MGMAVRMAEPPASSALCGSRRFFYSFFVLNLALPDDCSAFYLKHTTYILKVVAINTKFSIDSIRILFLKHILGY
jgi:hypothetical protein